MKWSDAGEILAKNGLDLLASAIPGGSFVQKIVADLFGVNNNPDDVYKALQSASPDKFIELLKIQNQNKTDLEKLKLQTDADIIDDVNKTMQVEATSEHWVQYAWRPFWGFISAIAFFYVCVLCGLLSWKAVGSNNTNAMNMIPQIITNFSLLFSIPAAILGIASWQRGIAKIKSIKNRI